MLRCAADTHADDIETASALRRDMKPTDKLMLQRARKYQLFPTGGQRKQLLGFMGTCRWTYN
ncbi:hypothetical protein V7S43_014209 [Phytophthora oleae]|uniref:Transposase putative helix-turn-helix domain-containing protein n=1 Tax=Phytophthora oleae TaxID=2107226 RepID=A0ABD3F1Y1_9STRA